uniref:Adenylyl cyclase-associated protein 1-like n=1 Tax=Sinocyclocheilus grahami TaxID=75366 RepID=A0A672K3Z1_SINGR
MAELVGLVQRLEVAVGRLEAMSSSGGGGGPAAASGAVSVYVVAYDNLISGPVAQYTALSQKIGGDVQKHAELMKQAFSYQRQLLVTASSSQKPSEVSVPAAYYVECLNKTCYCSTIQNFGVGSILLMKVSYAPKPGPYVKEMQDAAMFYTNRVLKDYKEKDKMHVEWVSTYVSIWTELQAYIKQHHTTGLSWSKTVSHILVCSVCPTWSGCLWSGDSGATSHNALFASINKGADITKGLKHVSDDQKTHKNPTLKVQGGPLPSGPKPFAARPTAAASPARTLPPVLELDGKKW